MWVGSLAFRSTSVMHMPQAIRFLRGSQSAAAVSALYADRMTAGSPEATSPAVTVMKAQECISSLVVAWLYMIRKLFSLRMSLTSLSSSPGITNPSNRLRTASISTALAGHPRACLNFVSAGGILIPRSLNSFFCR